MANEAVLIFETELPIPFTVADASGIEKGAILKLVDPMTASGSALADAPIAGIAATEKIAGDGNIKLGVFRKGIFRVSLSGSVTIGNPLVADVTQNYVRSLQTANLSGARIIGHALETGTTNETILAQIDVGSGGAAV